MLVLYVPAAIADSEGDVTQIYSGGQMFSGSCENSGSRGCDAGEHVFNAQGATSFNVNKYVRSSVKRGTRG